MEYKELDNRPEDSIRITLLDEKGNPLKLQVRDDGYQTTIDSGWETLNLKEDIAKINFYQTVEYIDLWYDRKFKVVKRTFMPCRPVSLYLMLKEI